MTFLIEMNAEEIYECFVKANINCFGKEVYDEETDPNSLLGRPGQYISKVNFRDSYCYDDEPDC